MLPEPVEGFVGTPQLREKLDMVGRLAIDDDGHHRNFRLLEQRLAAGILKRDAAVFACNDCFDL